jgi:hypothetical protein
MARPEGFEPPTLGLEGTRPRRRFRRNRLIFQRRIPPGLLAGRGPREAGPGPSQTHWQTQRQEREEWAVLPAGTARRRTKRRSPSRSIGHLSSAVRVAARHLPSTSTTDLAIDFPLPRREPLLWTSTLVSLLWTATLVSLLRTVSPLWMFVAGDERAPAASAAATATVRRLRVERPGHPLPLLPFRRTGGDDRCG